MNEALIDNAAAMYDLEFILRQKAQLKYLQKQVQSTSNSVLWRMLEHHFLWSPTPTYYLATIVAFLFIKRSRGLYWSTLLPFLMVPATIDYVKRDYYIKL